MILKGFFAFIRTAGVGIGLVDRRLYRARRCADCLDE